jgi:hypothetical protein
MRALLVSLIARLCKFRPSKNSSVCWCFVSRPFLAVDKGGIYELC